MHRRLVEAKPKPSSTYCYDSMLIGADPIFVKRMFALWCRMKNSLGLSGVERRLLDVLAGASPGPVSAERLCAELWGPDIPLRRLRVLISRLRGKLGAHSIITIRGRGYAAGDLARLE